MVGVYGEYFLVEVCVGGWVDYVVVVCGGFFECVEGVGVE